MGIYTLETDEKRIVSRKNSTDNVTVIEDGRRNINNRGLKTFVVSLSALLLLALFIVSAILINSHFEQLALKKNKRKLIAENTQPINRSSGAANQTTAVRPEQMRREQEHRGDRNRTAEAVIHQHYLSIVRRYNREQSANERITVITETERGAAQSQMSTVSPEMTITDIANFTNLIADLNGFYHLAEPVLGKRDPDLLFAGERIKLPDNRVVLITKRDFLWRIALEELKRNYRTNFNKILEFQKKIRMFRKRRVDIHGEVFIMVKEVENTLKRAYTSGQKLILKLILKELKTLPKR